MAIRVEQLQTSSMDTCQLPFELHEDIDLVQLDVRVKESPVLREGVNKECDGRSGKIRR